MKKKLIKIKSTERVTVCVCSEATIAGVDRIRAETQSHANACYRNFSAVLIDVVQFQCIAENHFVEDD